MSEVKRVYHEILTPSTNRWLDFELWDNGVTTYEGWDYIWYDKPRKLNLAGCLIERFEGSNSEWQRFIRRWYWKYYKDNPIVCRANGGT